MNNLQAENLSRELIATAETVYLTTMDSDGFPETRAMLNLCNARQYPGLIKFFQSQDEFTLYFTTNTSLPKVARIADNPKSCVYFCRSEEWQGLALQGLVEIVTDYELKKQLWQEGWTLYYPGGLDDPEYTVLRFMPLSAKGYDQLQHYTLAFEDGK